MKRDTSIKLKAAFLTIVFALNMIIGFACSMGLGMSSITGPFRTLKVVAAIHENISEATNCHQKKEGGTLERTEGTCCANKVKEFGDIDKAVPTSKETVQAAGGRAFLAAYSHFIVLPYTDVVRNIKPFVRSYHPPIPDIRIAIQSFQI